VALNCAYAPKFRFGVDSGFQSLTLPNVPSPRLLALDLLDGDAFFLTSLKLNADRTMPVIEPLGRACAQSRGIAIGDGNLWNHREIAIL